MTEKSVCFAGHRLEHHNLHIESDFENLLISAIKQGYSTFYTSGYGYFDTLGTQILKKLKNTYPIQIIRVISSYSQAEKLGNHTFDEVILLDLNSVHYKQRIIKLNEWMVDNSSLIISHLLHTYKSGAYQIVKYAQKQNKEIWHIKKDSL